MFYVDLYAAGSSAAAHIIAKNYVIEPESVRTRNRPVSKCAPSRRRAVVIHMKPVVTLHLLAKKTILARLRSSLPVIVNAGRKRCDVTHEDFGLMPQEQILQVPKPKASMKAA
jgi:hypothetical protein